MSPNLKLRDHYKVKSCFSVFHDSAPNFCVIRITSSNFLKYIRDKGCGFSNKKAMICAISPTKQSKNKNFKFFFCKKVCRIRPTD